MLLNYAFGDSCFHSELLLGFDIWGGGGGSYHTYTCEMVPVLGYAIIFPFLCFEYSELVFLMLYFTC